MRRPENFINVEPYQNNENFRSKYKAMNKTQARSFFNSVKPTYSTQYTSKPLTFATPQETLTTPLPYPQTHASDYF